MDTKHPNASIHDKEEQILLQWLHRLEVIEKWTPQEVDKLFPCDSPNDAKFYEGKSHMAHKWSKMTRKCAMDWLQRCDPENQRISIGKSSLKDTFRRQYEFTLMLAFVGLPEDAPNLPSVKEQRERDPNFQKTTTVRFLCSIPKEELFALFAWFDKSYQQTIAE